LPATIYMKNNALNTRRSAKVAQIVINKSFKLEHSAEIKDTFVELLRNYDAFEVKFEDFKNLDAGALRLIVAFSNCVSATDKKIVYQFSETEHKGHFLTVPVLQGAFC
jgi:hypothetical protein